MLEGEVRVVNRLGLHARAAAQLIRVAGGFSCRILLIRLDGSVQADAKSILEVLTLAAPVNSVLILTADGVDEADAFDAVMNIFASGFGEG